MTITTLSITYIASISLAFFLGRKSVKNEKGLQKDVLETKKTQAGSYTGEEEKGSLTGSRTPNTPILDLDPDNPIENLALEALETSEEILEISAKLSEDKKEKGSKTPKKPSYRSCHYDFDPDHYIQNLVSNRLSYLRHWSRCEI